MSTATECVGVRRLPVRAHRVAFFLHHGRWPDPCALHRCDNPPCVNPAHLFEGTKADNSRDMASKGRDGSHTHPELVPRGEAHGIAKLTAEKVAAIRDALASGEPQRSIASRFGVHHSAIGKMHRGQTWSHVV
jgi:hypothetical protein